MCLCMTFNSQGIRFRAITELMVLDHRVLYLKFDPKTSN